MLTIDDLTYRIEGRALFEGASAFIAAGWKVGVVGRNGSGKSTLMRLIVEGATGEIRLQRGARIGTVAQEIPQSDRPLIEEVLSADQERAALLIEAETAVDPMRIAEIHQRLDDIDAHSAEARAALASHRRISIAPAAPSPAAGGCAPRLAGCCFRPPTF
jgi:ATP-binding cassette subfamily F protein 3